MKLEIGKVAFVIYIEIEAFVKKKNQQNPPYFEWRKKTQNNLRFSFFNINCVLNLQYFLEDF